MIKQHLKQAGELLRSNKLYSGIYIAGTALSITMVMIVAIHFYLRSTNLYPETNRDRSLYISRVSVSPKDKGESWSRNGPLSHTLVKEALLGLKTAKAVSANELYVSTLTPTVTSAAAPRAQAVYPRYVNDGFWQVYDFEFLSGKPFNRADFDNGHRVAVLSEGIARHLFPDTDAVGQELKLSDVSYTVVGVVAGVPYQMGDTFAHLWLPYTSNPAFSGLADHSRTIGNIMAVVLPRENVSADEVKAELAERLKQFGDARNVVLNLEGQPDGIWESIFRLGGLRISKPLILVILGLLMGFFFLVPALNLTSLNSSILEGRLSELGVRKAFGASNWVIIRQVLLENFVLTLVGAFVGLLLAYLVLASSIYDNFINMYLSISAGSIQNIRPFSSSISAGMLLRPGIFALAFTAAFILNTLTSLVPAWRFTRHSIVEALAGTQSNKK